MWMMDVHIGARGCDTSCDGSACQRSAACQRKLLWPSSPCREPLPSLPLPLPSLPLRGERRGVGRSAHLSAPPQPSLATCGTPTTHAPHARAHHTPARTTRPQDRGATSETGRRHSRLCLQIHTRSVPHSSNMASHPQAHSFTTSRPRDLALSPCAPPFRILPLPAPPAIARLTMSAALGPPTSLRASYCVTASSSPSRPHQTSVASPPAPDGTFGAASKSGPSTRSVAPQRGSSAGRVSTGGGEACGR